ncbi:FixH family protein [Algoriphagus aquimarinus]|uniref:FixH protein n=1 Tax=Algoriphagus aquimarinus TaxID=237018 RepID=A0A1I1BST5_9BACT|nr:FixH family protein [Algoriphagus aquimarinus]SFB52882.1 FixH protein [Algoriphagus aquimarinus]|tara:strand:+ start:7879 stop:8304 length:426 start_codon:yes stop_codon:yes gene_type:complete
MDWGKGILLTIIGFVALIMTLVVISVRMDGIELVTENYYEEEIKYQDRIDQTNQASSLDKEVISYDAQNKSVLLDLPNGSEAMLHLFRPSDSSLDQELAVSVTEIGKTSVSLLQLKSGYWRVKLSWNVDGVDYYEEKKITI